MLNSRMIALATAIAILGVGSQASAYTIDVATSDALVPSATVTLTNSVTTEVGESFNAWQWSIECNGCTVQSYTYAEFAPNLMWWNNQVYGAPQPVFFPGTTPSGQGASGIGGDGSDWIGGGTFVVGSVEVLITSATGSITPFIGGGEGFGASLGGTVLPTSLGGVSWVPEPGTAMLLALGLGGLGIMGRRNS